MLHSGICKGHHDTFCDAAKRSNDQCQFHAAALSTHERPNAEELIPTLETTKRSVNECQTTSCTAAPNAAPNVPMRGINTTASTALITNPTAANRDA